MGGGEACSHLSEEERQVIRIEIGNGTIIRRIGLMLGRNASTVGREIKRDTWFPSVLLQCLFDRFGSVFP